MAKAKFGDQCRSARDQFVKVWQDKDNNAEFFKRHRILISREGSISQIKYGSGCKFSDEWMLASRGVTVIEEEDEGKNDPTFVFAFNKFFNRHEFLKYMREDPLDFLQRNEQYHGYEILLTMKHDGSNIKFFVCADGILRATTLGFARPHAMQSKGGLTFTAISLELLHNQYPDMEKWLLANPGGSFLCELITPWNHIVNSYRHNGRGWLEPLTVMDAEGIPRRSLLFKALENASTHIYHHATTARTFDSDVVEFLKRINTDSKKKPAAWYDLGNIPEGLVVYLVDKKQDEMWPCMKIKTPAYVQAHTDNVHVAPGSVKDWCRIQRLVLLETWDDQPERTHAQEVYAQAFQVAIHKLALEFFQPLLAQLCSLQQSSKHYGLFVSSYHFPKELKWLRPKLFRDRLDLQNDVNCVHYLYTALIGKDGSNTKDKLQTLQKQHGEGWWEM